LLDFRYVHLYRHNSLPNIEKVVDDVARVFPKCAIDIRGSFPLPDLYVLDGAMVSDTRQPFDCQPKEHEFFNLYGRPVPLYDGFVVQRLLAQAIPESESGSDHLHIIFTDLLTCTFSEDDWRYHARAVICGTPSMISTTGIVEAPAKPGEFYTQPFAKDLKKKLAGRFIDYGDMRMADTAAGYVLQAAFFFLTDGEPFCDSDGCRLLNAHWQEDLIRTQVESPELCLKHRSIANKFNRRLEEKERM
jgi:hypothetical protein